MFETIHWGATFSAIITCGIIIVCIVGFVRAFFHETKIESGETKWQLDEVAVVSVIIAFAILFGWLFWPL